MLNGFVDFSLLMALALAINYVLQLTMFTAEIALFLRASARNMQKRQRQAALTDPPAEADESSERETEETPDTDVTKEAATVTGGRPEPCADALEEIKTSALREWLGGSFGEKLTQSVPVQLLVLAVVAALLSANFWLVFVSDEMQIGMPNSYFFPDSSYLLDFNDAMQRHFGGNPQVAALLPEPGIDYGSATVQQALLGMCATLSQRSDVIAMDCWVASFVAWQAARPSENGTLPEFLRQHPQYSRDIVMLGSSSRSSSAPLPADISMISRSRLTLHYHQPVAAGAQARFAQYEAITAVAGALPFAVTAADPSWAIHVSRFQEIEGLICFTLALSVAAVFLSLVMLVGLHAASLCTLNVGIVVIGVASAISLSLHALFTASLTIADGILSCLDLRCLQMLSASSPGSGQATTPSLSPASSCQSASASTTRCTSSISSSTGHRAAPPRTRSTRCSCAGRRCCTGRQRRCWAWACWRLARARAFGYSRK